MKKIKTLMVIIFVILLPFISKSQYATFPIGNTYTSDIILRPFSQNYFSYGLNVTGSIHLNTDSSMVRVVLFSELNNEPIEYLVYEGNKLLSPSGDSTLDKASEETCLLNHMRLDSIKIEIINASITLSNFKSDTVYKANIESLRNDSLDSLRIHKINFINQQLIAKKLTWRAGNTNIARMSYAEKKQLFNGTKLPNLQGFDYYAGGYFSFIGDITPTSISTGIVNNFDWRDRHRANDSLMTNGDHNPYYDHDDSLKSGWIPPRFQCQSGYTCWAYSSVYSLQSIINLYYNQLIDLDLSEQNVVTCTNSNCLPNSTGTAINYMKNFGIVNESCFPRVDCDDGSPQPICSDICNNPLERIKIDTSIGICGRDGELQTKLNLIKNGPLAASLWQWGHAMSLIGYGVVKEGEIVLYGDTCFTGHQFTIQAGSPDIGKPYYIFENSWGGWGPWYSTPFMKVILNANSLDIFGADVLLTPLYDSLATPRDVACNDYDGDGFYNWGIGNKPTTCSSGSPAEEDCNDADSTMGPYNEFFYCQLICDFEPYSQNPILINSDTVWNTNLCLNRDVIVKYGKTLTIKSSVSFVSEAKIIVEPTAKLIVDGGILSCGIEDNKWQGIKVQGDYFNPQTQQYQGYVELKNNACILNAIIGVEAVYDVIVPENEPNEEILAGGIIVADGANFGNNLISISMQPYKNLYMGLESDNVSSIKNCYFLNNEENNEEENKIFIRLEGVKGIKIQNNTFSDNTTDPLNTRSNGIEAYDASFKVTQLDGTSTNNQDLSNKFIHLYYGIKALYTSSALAPTIDYSLLDSCYRGVYISGNTSATIIRNYFKVPDDDYNCYGLYIDNSTGYKVEKNVFEGYDLDPGDIGLIVNNSYDELNMIFFNTFRYLYFGIIAQNDNRGYDIYTGLKIKCNYFMANSLLLNMKDISVTNDNPFIPSGISIYQGYDPEDDDPTAPASNIFSYSTESSFEDLDNGDQNFVYYYNTYNPPPFTADINLVPRDTHYTANTITIYNTLLKYKKDTSCVSTIQGGALDELFAYMSYTQTELSNTARQIKQLVDGGNTPVLNTQVELSQPPQALQLRNNLLGKSPFLSDSVLISAITNEDALTSLMLKQVLIANPQTPKSEIIMAKLNNRTNPIPEYMIKEIEGGKNTVGNKEKLEARLAYYYQERELTYNEILRRYKNDTIHKWAKDSLLSILNNRHTPWAKYQLIFSKIYDKNTSEALQMLENIPFIFDLSEYQLNSYYDYKDFINLFSQLTKDSIGNYVLSNTQKQLLSDLAAKGNNFVSSYARNLLILADSLPYNEPIILPHEQPGKVKNPSKTIVLNDNILKVFPNPAMNYFTVEYELDETAGSAIVEMLDLTGKKLKSFNVYDKQNQIVVETKDLQTGIYYIRLLVEGAVCNTQKISVIK